MEAITQIETFYVLRLTRLESARMLVDPKEAQTAIRALLQPGDETEQTEMRAALSGNGHRPRALPAPSTATKKAMRKLIAGSKRVACPECGERFLARGINSHIARKHRRNGPEHVPPPVETETGMNGES